MERSNKALHFTERREVIRNRIQERGVLFLNKSALATEFNVPRSTIHRDFQALGEHLDAEDLAITRIALTGSIRFALSEMTTILETGSTAEKIRAARSIGMLSIQYAHMQQMFGLLKENVTTGDVVNIVIEGYSE